MGETSDTTGTAPRRLTPDEQRALGLKLRKLVRGGRISYTAAAVKIGVTEPCVRSWCTGDHPIGYPYQERVMRLVAELDQRSGT